MPLANYTVSAEIQCENIQKEPCEFIVLSKNKLEGALELQMQDQFLCKFSTFVTAPEINLWEDIR